MSLPQKDFITGEEAKRSFAESSLPSFLSRKRARPGYGGVEELGEKKAGPPERSCFVVGRNYFRLKKAFMPGY